MRAVLPLVLAVALLAGCASDPASTTTLTRSTAEVAPEPEALLENATSSEDASIAPVARVVTTFLNGSLTSVGFASSEPVGFCCPTLTHSGENFEGVFTPEAGILGIVVELAWTDPTFDLDLWVYGPDYSATFPPELNGTGISSSRGHYWYDYSGQAGSPNGHVAIVVLDPEALALAGEWGWGLTSKSSNATPFTVAVSLFYGEPPSETFSALAA